MCCVDDFPVTVGKMSLIYLQIHIEAQTDIHKQTGGWKEVRTNRWKSDRIKQGTEWHAKTKRHSMTDRQMEGQTDTDRKTDRYAEVLKASLADCGK